MNLIYRNAENEQLSRQLWMSRNKGSRLTLLSGVRGTGKTALAVTSTKGTPRLYFKLSGRTDKALLTEFVDQVHDVLDVFVPNTVRTVRDLIGFLVGVSRTKPFTLILDGFDSFVSGDPDTATVLRKKLDELKEGGHLNLIVLTSSPDLTDELFFQKDSPFRNKVDLSINLKPFTIDQIAEGLASQGKNLSSEDLLAFYMVTGGMPEYVSLLSSHSDLTKEGIYTKVFSEGSRFVKEGGSVLTALLGKNREVYVSILHQIAMGNKSQRGIESKIGGSNVGGHLMKLENDYGLIRKVRPLLAGPSSRNVVRYEIVDLSILFWLRYIGNNRLLVDCFEYDEIRRRALEDFPVLAKEVLKRCFAQRVLDQNPGIEVGGDWKSGQSEEIDIVGVNRKSRSAILGAVEFSEADFDKKPFLTRVESLRKGLLRKYSIDSRLFTLDEL